MIGIDLDGCVALMPGNSGGTAQAAAPLLAQIGSAFPLIQTTNSNYLVSKPSSDMISKPLEVNSGLFNWRMTINFSGAGP